MTWIVFCVLLVGCPASTSPLDDPAEAPKIPPAGFALQQLGWLAGSWAAIEDGVVTEEHWTVPRGGSMLGMNRVSNDERMIFFEHLRIEARGGGVVYLAAPVGQEPTPFKLASSENTKAVFTNPEHDFPRTITYEREGDALFVVAEGISGDEPKTATWKWQRVQ